MQFGMAPQSQLQPMALSSMLILLATGIVGHAAAFSAAPCEDGKVEQAWVLVGKDGSRPQPASADSQLVNIQMAPKASCARACALVRACKCGGVAAAAL